MASPEQVYQWSSCRPLCDEHKKIEYILSKMDSSMDKMNVALDKLNDHQVREEIQDEERNWFKDNLSAISVGCIVGILCLFIGHLI